MNTRVYITTMLQPNHFIQELSMLNYSTQRQKPFIFSTRLRIIAMMMTIYILSSHNQAIHFARLPLFVLQNLDLYVLVHTLQYLAFRFHLFIRFSLSITE